MKNKRLLFLFPLLFSSSCSPLKSSAREEKHQAELTLHEVQTNLDDLRHDVHCFQTEMQILDGKLKHHENALSGLKQGYLETQEARMDELYQLLRECQKKLSSFETAHQTGFKDIRQLSTHANDTSAALVQYKERICELEKQILLQNRKFEEIVKLHSTLEQLMASLQKEESIPQLKVYKVKAGDSLEKIAKAQKITVDYLKKFNSLEQDRIVVGQELKIP